MAYTLPDGRLAVDVTSNKTLAAGDMGIVQNAIGDVVFTLPATAAALQFTVRNGGAKVHADGPAGAVDNDATVSISPASADQLIGNGFTAADNKDAVNTDGNVGDEMTVLADGTNGYHMVAIRGTWTREA